MRDSAETHYVRCKMRTSSISDLSYGRSWAARPLSIQRQRRLDVKNACSKRGFRRSALLGGREALRAALDGSGVWKSLHRERNFASVLEFHFA
eukprot:IDg1051t1